MRLELLAGKRPATCGGMMGNLLLVVMLGAAFGGCGALRMLPVAPQAVGDLKPEIEDADAGLVGVRADFSPKQYPAIVISPLKVSSSEIKDDEDARLAKDMTAYFQTQLVLKLQGAGIFTKVIDATVSTELPTNMNVLRLEGEITKLTEGNQALRYFVGFGAGAAKAQIETRLVDLQSRQVELVTADRRAAGMGIFGGDSRQFVTEGLDQMAEGYVRLLTRLARGERSGSR